jgi:PAS domain S-box-containing protein
VASLPQAVTDLDGWHVGAEDFLVAVLQSVAQPIWVVDPAGLIRFANPAAAHTLGYDDAAELLGRPSHETIHHHHPDGAPYPSGECPMLLPRTTGETVSRELDWFFRRDGSMFPVSYVSVPVAMSDGRGAVVAFTDIEDRLAAEAAMQHREAVLADEQSALRRLATLVAEGADPHLVFDAVCEETGRLFAATTVNLAHFTPDGFNLTISGWSRRGVHVPTGTRLPLEGQTINNVVRQTAAPGRFDSYEHSTGPLAERLRELGIRSEVGAPVVIEGRVWGALIAGTDEPEPLPAGIELRLAKFAELVATAVSNATSRAELIASRARIVQAADEQRRRVVRDLHDGAQQRLVNAVIALQLAQGRDDLPAEAAALVDSALAHATSAIEELRELAHGIHPTILTHHGLAAAVESLADRAPLPVEVAIPAARYPGAVESAAYFVVAEALTNVAKYARASSARVCACEEAGRLVLTIEDDGTGGAVTRPGGGLAGLGDRVTALEGHLRVESRLGAGTVVRAAIPLTEA